MRIEVNMAQRLQPSDSADKCINSTNRHIRLCNQLRDTEFLITSIKPVADICTAKQDSLKAATKEMEGAYDIWVFNDGTLDAAVRNAASRCKEFDRDNPGSKLSSSIFPEGTDVITGKNREDEPDVVDTLAVRIEKLGSEHVVFPYAAKLREAAQKSRAACNTYKESLKKVDIAKTELDIAKSELISKYLSNMFDSEKKFGREVTNRLFPILRSSGSSGSDSNGKDTGTDDSGK